MKKRNTRYLSVIEYKIKHLEKDNYVLRTQNNFFKLMLKSCEVIFKEVSDIMMEQQKEIILLKKKVKK